MTTQLRDSCPVWLVKPLHSRSLPRAHPALLQMTAIFAVASMLRLMHVTQPFVDALSWRESSVAMMAENFYRTNWNIFYPEVNWTGPGPGYQGRELQTVSYIAALIYVVVGQQDWVGRSVAIMFGLWGIFALYQLVRRVGDDGAVTASAAVMAVLPGSVYLERSFVAEPAMVALVTTSLWMLVVYLQTQRPRYLLAAGVIGAWGAGTKLPGLIVGLPMAYATWAILGPRRLPQPRNLVAMASLALLILAPVSAYYLWVRHLSLSHPPYHFAGQGNWLWDDGLRQWWDQAYFLPRLRFQLESWLWTPPVIALVVFGLLSRPPRKGSAELACADQLGTDTKKAAWLFHWWILACVIYYAIGAKELALNPSNLHLLNPAAAALTGHALVSIASFGNGVTRVPAWLMRALPMLLIAIIAVSGQQGLAIRYKPWSEDSYELGLALRDVSQPGDLVVTLLDDFGSPVAIYYSQRRGWVFPPAERGEAPLQLPDDDKEAIRLLEELRMNGAGWLGILDTENILRNYHSEFMAHIQRTCQLNSEGNAWTIYRILSPAELRGLQGPFRAPNRTGHGSIRKQMRAQPTIP